jgi:hypothetical protein
MAEPLCDALLSKIREQVELTDHLIGVLSPEELNWAPQISGAWCAALLLGHLLDCLAGICAVLLTVHPNELAHFHRLRDMPVNRPHAVSEARAGLTLYQQHIDEGFGLLKDLDLAKRIPTIFAKQGEPVLTLLLGNLEHLINHKHQLFMYLKLMGRSVESRDLYRFREEC